MSLILYLASDEPLDVVPNPHCKSRSVNEALEIGITDIPDELLAPCFDRDQPNVILWSDRNIIIDTENGTFDDGGFDDDFEIYDMNEHYGPSETTKPYRVIVDCNWTPGRAKNICRNPSAALCRPFWWLLAEAKNFLLRKWRTCSG